MTALNEKEYVLGLFLDFSKAFDTINHILFDQLKLYGIRRNALCWLKSYLANRYQYVEYNGAIFSRKNSIWCPTGSILDQLFFLIYVNDLSLVSINLSTDVC